MSTQPDEDIEITPGRPIRMEPVPPGFWPLILGLAIGALAPLFGFLFGTMQGNPPEDMFLHPIFWGLFIGIIIGGFGLALAVWGGFRLARHRRGTGDQS